MPDVHNLSADAEGISEIVVEEIGSDLTVPEERGPPSRLQNSPPPPYNFSASGEVQFRSNGAVGQQLQATEHIQRSIPETLPPQPTVAQPGAASRPPPQPHPVYERRTGDTLVDGVQTGAQHLEREEFQRARGVEQANQYLYETQQGNLMAELSATETRCLEMARKPSWRGIEYVMSMLSKAEDRLAVLHGSLTQHVCSMTNASQIERVTRQGNIDMKQIGERIRAMKNRMAGMSIRDEIEVTATPNMTVGTPVNRSYKNYLNKVDIPSFSGELADYAEFKSRYHGLTDGEGHKDSVLLMYLENAIPKNLRFLLIGAKTMMKAWQRLDEKFGDKQQNIISIHDRLIEMEVPKGREYDQIEYLAYNIDSNIHMLEELGAASSVTNDLRMVSTMLAKLPATARSRWSRWCNGQSVPVTPGVNEWELFRKWVNEEKQAALREKRHDRMINKQAKVSALHQPVQSSKQQCSKCFKPGHTSSTCVLPGSLADINCAEYDEAQMCAAIQGLPTNEARVRKYKEAQEKFGNCCHCSKPHIYRRKMLGEEFDWPSCKLLSCPAFLKLSSTEKGAVVESSGACPRCLSWLHSKEQECIGKSLPCDRKAADGRKCKRAHHGLLHSSENMYCEASCLKVIAAATRACPVVLLEIEKVTTESMRGKNGEAILFYDPGATLSLCSHRWARRHQLTGGKVTIYMRVVGRDYEQLDSVMYEFYVRDRQGKQHLVKAVGLETITEGSRKVDMAPIKKAFPQLKMEDVERPEGEVDVLLGMELRGMHPVAVETQGNLRLVESQFGTGWIMTGATPGEHQGESVCAMAVKLSRASLSPPIKARIHHTLSRFPDFIELEEEEAARIKACRQCRGCMECKFRSQGLSQAERDSIQVMEDSVRKDPATNRIHVSYPFSPQADLQRSNYHQIKQIQSGIDKKIVKDGYKAAYDEELSRMIGAGVVSAILLEESSAWGGGVHYMPHFAVHNKESASTKLRIVVDSSCRNANSKLSFNDLMTPLPNALNDILGVILRWRCKPIALNYDLSKAYHSVRTGPRERHLRRFIHRFDGENQWKTFGYDCVAFGDQPAPNALEIAKEEVANMGRGC